MDRDVTEAYLSVRCLHWWAGRELLDAVAANVEEGEGKKGILLDPAVGRLLLCFFQMIMNFPCFLIIFYLCHSLVFRGASLFMVPDKEIPCQIFRMRKQERHVQ